MSQGLSPLLHLRSAVNAIFFQLRRRRRGAWAKKPYFEVPALALETVTPEQKKIIKDLRNKYGIKFELNLNEPNSLENYHYLHLFDQFTLKSGWKPDVGKEWVDVGCKNFYYAQALHAYFKPEKLTGIELDAYPIYNDLQTRSSYADFYVTQVKNTHFLAMDFCEYAPKCDGITFLYPFVVPEPLVKWSLPLSEFKPEALFRQAYSTLRPGGSLLMINQGESEFEAASRYAKTANFNLKHRVELSETLLARALPPVVSVWEK